MDVGIENDVSVDMSFVERSVLGQKIHIAIYMLNDRMEKTYAGTF